MSSTAASQPSASKFFAKNVKTTNIGRKNIPWVEKYRPKSISEIVSQDEIVLVFKKVVETNELPNLLFFGPPGTGKTSSILALARDLFGHDIIQNRVLELNASDERGIQVIRDKVKAFAQLSVGDAKHSITGKPLPPYKLIILDEADNLTSAAQAALRRIMETCLNSTRFCLICNYITKIIEPIISRCSSFYFKPLPPPDCLSCLAKIRTKESLPLSDQNLEFLITASQGDLRKAVMYIQCCRYMSDSILSDQTLMDICGIVPPTFIERIFKLINSKNLDGLINITNEFVSQGYSVTKFLNQLQEHVLTWRAINDIDRAKILIKFSETDKMLADGSGEYLQLLSILTFIDQILNQQS